MRAESCDKTLQRIARQTDLYQTRHNARITYIAKLLPTELKNLACPVERQRAVMQLPAYKRALTVSGWTCAGIADCEAILVIFTVSQHCYCSRRAFELHGLGDRTMRVSTNSSMHQGLHVSRVRKLQLAACDAASHPY